jgi:hypothetical protein
MSPFTIEWNFAPEEELPEGPLAPKEERVLRRAATRPDPDVLP